MKNRISGRLFCAALAFAAAGFVALPAYAQSGAVIVYPDDVTVTLQTDPYTTNPDALFPGTNLNPGRTGNRVTVNGGNIRNVLGGINMVILPVLNVTGNSVIINDGTVYEAVYGGVGSGPNPVTNNSVTVNGGTVAVVYGGESGTADATGNSVTINGGTVTGDIYGGNSFGNSKTNNRVTINGGTINGDVYGGWSGGGDSFTGNTLYKNSNTPLSDVLTFEIIRFGYSGDANIAVLNAASVGVVGVVPTKLNTGGHNILLNAFIHEGTGTGGIEKTGAGTLTLTGTSIYTGGTTVSQGTLQIGNGGTTGSIIGNIVNNANLAFNHSDVISYGGVLSGNGTLSFHLALSKLNGSRVLDVTTPIDFSVNSFTIDIPEVATGSSLQAGDKITLIDNVVGTPVNNGGTVRCSGFEFLLSVEAGKLVATVASRPPYTVTVPIGVGVSTNKTLARPGETVTLTVTPLAGFELVSISATSVTLNRIALALTYTFIMPAHDVTVAATFKKSDAQIAWEKASVLIENATFTLTQKEAETEYFARYSLAEFINALIKDTGFTLSADDIVIYRFRPATAGDNANPPGVNGLCEFRVTPLHVRMSAYGSAVIIATLFDTTATEVIPQANRLKAWTTQDGVLHVVGLTQGKSLYIYNLYGQLIYQATAGGGEAKIILPARGIYIVSSGNVQLKIRY